MAGREFHLDVVLGAILNSRFLNTFAKAQKQVEEFEQKLKGLENEAKNLGNSFDKGLIDSKKFEVLSRVGPLGALCGVARSYEDAAAILGITP